MEKQCLARLAGEAGIAASYINAHGLPQAVSAQTQSRLLEAMNMNRPARAPASPLMPVEVCTQGKAIRIALQQAGDYRWRLECEQGQVLEGRCTVQLNLPPTLALGYHQLTLTQEEHSWSMLLIVAPARCYEPPQLLAGKKLWGACVQLYTLRSENNWGVGDFGDLKAMLQQMAGFGGAFIGLNPLHALYPAIPEAASPYSPSSRNWLNVIYIDVTQIEDFRSSDEAQRWWRDEQTQEAIQKARATQWVDYTAIMALKLPALRLAFQRFCTRSAHDERQRAFRQFVADGGDSLHYQALFDALHEVLYARDNANWGWPAWPQEYRDPHSAAVTAFSIEQREKIDFYLWLQWVADQQLEACYAAGRQAQMALGLYRDLAVGVSEGGSELWCARDLYCTGASVGAPPDILGPLGQNWGLPPMDPHRLRAEAYRPFITLLRSNMRHCGALRIDHVMSLLRLWWIPYGENAGAGAYVAYPVDDLLAILALESHRHQCMVIGEDLGTVPQEIVGKLRDRGVYSYKVLYFEHDGQGEYCAPGEYPVQAMATISTHDLPTLRGFWQCDDLNRGESLGLYPDKAILKTLFADRECYKQGLLDGLHRYGLIPQRTGKTARRMAMTPILNRGLQRYVATSASALLGVQPEDWLDMELPVNIPGTTDEYPNWRRKLSATLEEMFNDRQVISQLRDLNGQRKRA